jgi:hypothetical protein
VRQAHPETVGRCRPRVPQAVRRPWRTVRPPGRSAAGRSGADRQVRSREGVEDLHEGAGGRRPRPSLALEAREQSGERGGADRPGRVGQHPVPSRGQAQPPDRVPLVADGIAREGLPLRPRSGWDGSGDTVTSGTGTYPELD